MIRLYDNHLSGNGYKPRLLLAHLGQSLAHLGQSYERVEIDILKGESRTPVFLAMNPNGRAGAAPGGDDADRPSVVVAPRRLPEEFNP